MSADSETPPPKSRYKPLPKKTSQATNAARGSRHPRSRKERSPNAWTRKRIDYAELEAVKMLVETIVQKDVGDEKRRFRKEIRISLLPWSLKGYIDMRVYMNGRSTGQGILCHVDLWPQFLAGCIAADRRLDQERQKGNFPG